MKLLPDDLLPHEYRHLAEHLARVLATTLADYARAVERASPAAAERAAELGVMLVVGDARHEAAMELGRRRAEAPRLRTVA